MHALARKQNKWKKLSCLFQIDSIDLKQYITRLSQFVGESITKKKEKNEENSISTTTIDDDVSNNDVSDNDFDYDST